jgi:hypothetical protein
MLTSAKTETEIQTRIGPGAQARVLVLSKCPCPNTQHWGGERGRRVRTGNNLESGQNNPDNLESVY